MRPRLSICIATRNRGPFIGATLSSILSQSGPGVEVVVVDGGSTDETPRVVGDLERNHPQLRYFRQEKNGGFGPDYCRAVSLSSGEYVWLFCDDDLFVPGAVDRVLTEIARGYSLIVPNAQMMSFDLKEISERNRIGAAADRQYSPADHEQLFIDTAPYLSYIGAVIIRREIWEAREKSRYFDTGFFHVGTIFERPFPGEAVLISEPLITLRQGNALWISQAVTLWMCRWPALIWSLPFSDAAKRAVVDREPWKRVKHLLFYRALGALDPAEVRRTLEPLTTLRRDRARAHLVARIPFWVANPAVALYFHLIRNRIASEELRASRMARRETAKRSRG